MMKNIIISLSIIFAFQLLSCNTSKSTSIKEQQKLENMMNSWMNVSKHDLLLEWGSPSSVSSDGKGGEILTFEQLRRAYLYNTGYVTVVHRYMFYVNSQNIIYNWRYDRNGRYGH